MRRLAAVGLAFLLFAGSMCLCELWLPAQDELDPSLDYRWAYDYFKERSPALIGAAVEEGSTLVFGSSEFYPSPFLAQHPANLPEEYGVELNWVTVGSGGTQSLQHALLLGAVAPRLRTDKVVLILSPQWFTYDGVTAQGYRSKSSWEAYRAFMGNPALSARTREEAAERVAQLSREPARARGIEEGSLLALVEEPVRAFIDDRQLRWERQFKTLEGVYPPRAEGAAGGGSSGGAAGGGAGVVEADGAAAGSGAAAGVEGRKGAGKPDWDALLADATADAARATTGNDFGILTEYYEENLAEGLAESAGESVDDRFVPSREFDDLRLFFTVCRENGITPLLVIMPVNGPWYDHTQHPKTDREAFYEEVRELCAEMGARCADFSAQEYDKGFFFDTLHLGWRGWVQVAREIERYAEEAA